MTLKNFLLKKKCSENSLNQDLFQNNKSLTGLTKSSTLKKCVGCDEEIEKYLNFKLHTSKRSNELHFVHYKCILKHLVEVSFVLKKLEIKCPKCDGIVSLKSNDNFPSDDNIRIILQLKYYEHRLVEKDKFFWLQPLRVGKKIIDSPKTIASKLVQATTTQARYKIFENVFAARVYFLRILFVLDSTANDLNSQKQVLGCGDSKGSPKTISQINQPVFEEILESYFWWAFKKINTKKKAVDFFLTQETALRLIKYFSFVKENLKTCIIAYIVLALNGDKERVRNFMENENYFLSVIHLFQHNFKNTAIIFIKQNGEYIAERNLSYY